VPGTAAAGGAGDRVPPLGLRARQGQCGPCAPCAVRGAGAPAAGAGRPGVGAVAYRSRFADAALDRLFDAILQLRTPEECYRFFEDLCTVGELRALAQRWHVAQRLAAGATYEEIEAETGMSSATISRIKRFLLYGADGYRLVLDRLAEGGAARTGGEAPGPPKPAAGGPDPPRVRR
jgi:TrpR-related protein YerC/YecD